MSNQIVQINVSQIVGAAPSNLQKTGALVSQGGTTLTPGQLTDANLLTEMADLTPLLSGGVAISSITFASGLATVTLAGPSGIPAGDTLPVVIAGVTPAGWNGEWEATYVSADVYTFPIASSPGAAVTTDGVSTLEDVSELVAMATTFFAQGNAQSIYVLELGAGTTAQGVTALNTYIEDPQIPVYAYLVPSEWKNEATFPTMAKNYEATTAKVYFWVTCDLETYETFSGIKSVFPLVQSPDAPSTEFSLAGVLYVTLNYAPTNTNSVTPLCFAFVVGVTPYKTLTGPQQTALKAAFINWISTGAEGGIANTLVLWGTMADGNPFNYWYSVDWIQINVNLDLSNELINGSNNPLAPLYYNQAGINRLKKRAQGTFNRGISFGLVLAPAVVEAVDFITYTQDNPNDYPIGLYSGLSAEYTPARGFEQIIFNIVVANFVLS
jgi:hypothetical protein